MMISKAKFQKGTAGKTILLLADCHESALNAGRFAVKHLFDEKTTILLLQTFQKTSFGTTMLRNIKSLLHKIASEELTWIKDDLLKEFQIPAGSIKKFAAEGELQSILQHDLGRISKVSVVFGFGERDSDLKKTSKRIIRAVNKTDLRPVFLISDSITIIEDARIIVITDKEESLTSGYMNFLRELSENGNLEIEIITGENKRKIPISHNTAYYISEWMDKTKLKLNSAEEIFHQHVIPESPSPGVNRI